MKITCYLSDEEVAYIEGTGKSYGKFFSEAIKFHKKHFKTFHEKKFESEEKKDNEKKVKIRGKKYVRK